MAILTTSGRVALVVAIKSQALHLAIGTGDGLWGGLKEITSPFNSSGTLSLGSSNVADIVVKNADTKTAYRVDTDYSVNARDGVLRRLAASTIPANTNLIVQFTTSPPPEPVEQRTLQREVARRVVDESCFVTSDSTGDIKSPSGRYRISTVATNTLFVRVQWDYEDAAGAVIREQGLFTGTRTDASLPAGQKSFVPGQITDQGTLLVLQNTAPIIRQSYFRETYEMLVTF